MKEILIKLRTDNRYTQDQIAKMLGISRQSYIKYENGEVEPSVEMVRKLSHFYSVSYDVLIDNNLTYSENRYKYSSLEQPEYSVAESVPAYGKTDAAFDIEYFSEQLNYLKEVILSMQKRLVYYNLFDSKSQEKGTTVKKLNKEEFFKKYGHIKIDGSFVDEWRQMSLI